MVWIDIGVFFDFLVCIECLFAKAVALISGIEVLIGNYALLIDGMVWFVR
ncbi:hypothetical protein [Snodgrassella communis]|nr:hypothetical protein [Snodgrassella communis]